MIPVRSVDFGHSDVEVLLNVVEHAPACFVVHEANGHANSTKTPGTTDPVEVSLGIGVAASIVRNILGWLADTMVEAVDMTNIVDDHGNRLNVDATRKYIRSD